MIQKFVNWFKRLRAHYVFIFDVKIRHAIKEILKIPDDTPSNMLHSSTSVNGLSLLKAEWEAYNRI